MFYMVFDLQRALILSTISENEPLSISQLTKLLEMSGGTTIYRYLAELEHRRLIEIKKKGKSQIITTTNRAIPVKSENLKKIIEMFGIKRK